MRTNCSGVSARRAGAAWFRCVRSFFITGPSLAASDRSTGFGFVEPMAFAPMRPRAAPEESPMSREFGILFLHHTVNGVVRRNLASVRRQNPGATVVTMSAGKKLPGGYSLAATPEIAALHAVNARRSSDWLVCSWFAQRREHCRKWWIIEWDTFCSLPAREYYRPVWRFPFVVSSVRLLTREPEWNWFHALASLPPAYRPHATGAVPFLFLVSDRALRRICRLLLAEPLFAGNGELRFCTAATRCG